MGSGRDPPEPVVPTAATEVPRVRSTEDATTRVRWRRRGIRLSIIGIVSVAAIALAGLPLYVFPPQSPPQKADVVFVIGPASWWRVDWAEDLVDEGLADNMMFSVGSPDRVAECTEGYSVPVLCRRPDPFTTRGEIRWLRDEMERNGWQTATVITTTQHVVRTRYLVGRCISDGVQVVGRSIRDTPLDYAWHYLYQTGGFAKALVESGC